MSNKVYPFAPKAKFEVFLGNADHNISHIFRAYPYPYKPYYPLYDLNKITSSTVSKKEDPQHK